MMGNPKEPKDLGVKIGTPEGAFWNDLLKKCKDAILNAKREIEINDELAKYAAIRITEEREKLK